MKDENTPEPHALPQADDGAAEPNTAGPAPDASEVSDLSAATLPPTDLSAAARPPEVEPARLAPTAPVAEPVPAAPSRRGGFFAMLLGGALAAIGGFALSHYDLLQLQPNDQLAEFDSRIGAIEQAVKAETGPIKADAASAAAAATAATAEAAALTERLGTAEAALKSVNARITAIDQSLQSASAATEGGASAAALAALSAEVQALKARPVGDSAETRQLIAEAFAAWETDAAARAETEASAAKEQALAEAAKLALTQALDTGAPYAAALAAIGADTVPAPLAQYAETGLPTLAALQDSFADAARAALTASLRNGETGEDKFWSFLRIQTGARSLTPQEGSDPDAILSRAEAALRADDLDKALAEIATLPAEGQQAMAAWTAAAQTRAEAKQAVAPLVTQP